LLLLYRIAATAVAPLWLLYLALRQRGEARLPERLGRLPRLDGRPVWIQAVSVGEVRLALKLAAALQAGGIPVLLTSTTAAGLDLAERESEGGVTVAAFPLDLDLLMERALRRARPRCVLLMETEIWPVLLRRASRAGIPVLIGNGRISDRSMRRLSLLRTLLAPAMESVRVAAQDPDHAGRFEALGCSPGRVEVLGNMKYDLTPPPGFENRTADLRRIAGENRGDVWVAGSVREGEERAVLEAHRKLLESRPDARLILAPRHLERTALCLEVASALGLGAFRRGSAPITAWNVLVLDTMGDLWAAYELGRAAFVGGSLVPTGGQNVLEPAFLGKPVLFGPHTENFRNEARRLEESGGGIRVRDSADLALRLGEILDSPRRAEEAGRKARSVVLQHRGAVKRIADWLVAATSPAES